MIEFKKIEKEDIFKSDFLNMNQNNKLSFSLGKTAILYGPNGTGKTSLSKVFNLEENTDLILKFENREYTKEDIKNNDFFYIISDQNSRNIVRGKEEDFFLGTDIKKEYELKEQIERDEKVLLDSCNENIREIFLLTRVGDELIIKSREINEILYRNLRELCKARGRIELDVKQFVNDFSSLNKVEVDSSYDINKYKYLKEKYNDKLLKQIEKLDVSKLKKEEKIKQIDENEDAIKILEKYSYKNHECVVCENEIERTKILNKKNQNLQEITKSLSSFAKDVLNNILTKIDDENDPFELKNKIGKALEEGNITYINELKSEIEKYINIFYNEITNMLIDKVSSLKLLDKYNKYEEMLSKNPEINDEDFLLVQTLISENIGKNIEFIRTENNTKIKLRLGDQDLLGVEREKLYLSTGEQNFISLSFELLQAKNRKEKILVIDDPISSFDSIYKNKIIFLLKKLIQGKRQILLTHNLDLVKLMEYQQNNTYQMYIFNNIDGEENGFIEINEKEKKLLLKIKDLLELLSQNIFSEIIDEKIFLISIIPFMRGYSQIIYNKQVEVELTKLMHGYTTEEVNISEIYRKLFLDKNGQNTQHLIKAEHKLKVSDILSLNIDSIEILKDSTEYKLLNKTLKHSLTYLYLRLITEKTLVDKYQITINSNVYMLSQIIIKAFPNSKDKVDKNNMLNRVFFLSRKTLLNDFNHFEGNLSIFQPAIDITDSALKLEKDSILKKLDEL